MSKVAPSATPDFTELLTRPSPFAEGYWGLPKNDLYLGDLTVELSHQEVKRHLGRIAAVERVYDGPVIPLQDSLSQLRQQLRVRPHDKNIWVRMVDLNAAALHHTNPTMLQILALRDRTAAANFAYPRLGALNYAEDLGHYLMPMVFAVAQDEPSSNELENPYGYEQWSADHLVELGNQVVSGEDRPGTELYAFTELLRRPDAQSRRINFTTSMLLEIGEYFTHPQGDTTLPVREESIERSELLAESALALARVALQAKFFAKPSEETLHPSTLNQLLRRRHDIEIVDLHRRVKSGEVDSETARMEFADIQLSFLDRFDTWCRYYPYESGIAYEWLVKAILNAGIYVEDLVGTAYARSSTFRENCPEDNIPGNMSLRKQNHDVIYVVDGKKEKEPVQCKTGHSRAYAAPPIHVVNARIAMGISSYNPEFMLHFRDVAKWIRDIYEDVATAEQVWSVVGHRDKALEKAA